MRGLAIALMATGGLMILSLLVVGYLHIWGLGGEPLVSTGMLNFIVGLGLAFGGGILFENAD